MLGLPLDDSRGYSNAVTVAQLSQIRFKTIMEDSPAGGA